MRTWALHIFPALMLPVFAAAATFTPLEPTIGYSFANGISADGRVVVGEAASEAFRWASSTGIELLGDLPAGISSSSAVAVSADGSVVVGEADDFGNVAFRWTASSGMVGLQSANPNVRTRLARAVSADGSVIVGETVGQEAFRWTSNEGVMLLGGLPGSSITGRTASGVSADGSVIVGGATTSTGGQEAYRWTSSGGLIGLGYLPGDVWSEATAVSADGSVVVGASGREFHDESFRWTSSGGMTGLGNFWAWAVSADGNVVVGRGISDVSGITEAFLWTPASGVKRLYDVLLANGATGFTGWVLEGARGVSADGRWIVGNGIDPSGSPRAFIAEIPDTDGDGIADAFDNCALVANALAGNVPSTTTPKYQLDSDGDGYGNACDADLNNSGTVTTADYGLLRSVLGELASFSPLTAAADMNSSGTVTASDFGLLRARLGTAPGPSGLHP